MAAKAAIHANIRTRIDNRIATSSEPARQRQKRNVLIAKHTP
jgi:hypothetical protein